jgi:L-asparaginase
VTAGENLPVVAVVAAGGTISSVRQAGGGSTATPTLGADALIEQVPQLAAVAELRPVTYDALPSPHLTFADVFELYRLATQAVGDGAAGVVVTVGTDTLEEVAFALDLLWREAAPVVVTGAMRNASLPGPDGPANMFASVCVAASPEAAGSGVVVVFNDEIHAASLAQKRHTTSVGTFGSPTMGPVGLVSEGVVHFMWQRRGRRPVVDSDEVLERKVRKVAVLHMSLGEDEELLNAVASGGYDGLVIAGFGGAHVSKAIAEGKTLDELAARIPVVLTSRTRSGWILERTYGGFAGSETDLLQRGLISAGMLDPFKARVLLTLLLTAGRGRAEVEDAFSAVGARQ